MVTICDVGPCDRLQNEEAVPPPFVHAERFPRTAGAKEREGVETGVDPDAIDDTARLETVLGRELPGRLPRAGACAPVSG